MKSNPYTSPSSSNPGGKTRGTRWLIWTGIVLMTLSLACYILACAITYMGIHTVATSASSPKPDQLATTIARAIVPSIAGVFLAVVGIISLVTGLVIRHPVDRGDSKERVEA